MGFARHRDRHAGRSRASVRVNDFVFELVDDLLAGHQSPQRVRRGRVVGDFQNPCLSVGLHDAHRRASQAGRRNALHRHMIPVIDVRIIGQQLPRQKRQDLEVGRGRGVVAGLRCIICPLHNDRVRGLADDRLVLDGPKAHVVLRSLAGSQRLDSGSPARIVLVGAVVVHDLHGASQRGARLVGVHLDRRVGLVRLMQHAARESVEQFVLGDRTADGVPGLEIPDAQVTRVVGRIGVDSSGCVDLDSHVRGPRRGRRKLLDDRVQLRTVPVESHGIRRRSDGNLRTACVAGRRSPEEPHAGHGLQYVTGLQRLAMHVNHKLQSALGDIDQIGLRARRRLLDAHPPLGQSPGRLVGKQREFEIRGGLVGPLHCGRLGDDLYVVGSCLFVADGDRVVRRVEGTRVQVAETSEEP